MAKRRTARAQPRQSHQTRNRLQIGVAVVVVAVICIAIILRLQSSNNLAAGSAGMPTPIGYPESAQDIGTMVGRPASPFTLQDDTGQAVSFTGGQASRPTVLIFHMGFR